MHRGSGDFISRDRLANRLLTVRAYAYGAALLLTLPGLGVGRPGAGVATAVMAAAVVLAFVRWRSVTARLSSAIAVDVAVSALAWWYLPRDPTPALVLSLWAVTMVAFFCESESRRMWGWIIAGAEAGKWIAASTLWAGRFAQGSFLRDVTDSEWLVTASTSLGRAVILAGTYGLFKSIAANYRDAQLALGTSRDEYLRLLTSAPTAILVIQDGVLTFVNAAAGELLDAEPDELVGRSLLEFLPDGDRGRFAGVLDEVATSAETISLDHQFISLGSGEQRVVDVTFARSTFSGRDAVNAIMIDTTDRFAATQVLAASEARHRAFFERHPIALYRTSPDGTIIDANDATAALLGVEDRMSLIGRRATDFYGDPTTRTDFLDEIERIGRVSRHEIELTTVDGRAVWVRDAARLVVTDTGRMYEGAMVDISDRVWVESRLRTLVDRQAALTRLGNRALELTDQGDLCREAAVIISEHVDCGSVAVWIRDDEGQRLAAVVGALPVDEDAGDHLIASYTGGGRIVDLAEHLSRSPAIAPGRATSHQAVLARIPATSDARGLIAAFRTDLQPFSGEEQDFLEAVAATLGAAAERAEARQRMEQVIHSKDQFIATISHEVRTPLTVVAGLSQELRDRWQDFDAEELTALTSLLVHQAQDMSDLIEDLLVAARADIGKVEIKASPVDLNQEIRSVTAALIETDRIRHDPDGPVIALADPGRLRQILRNLITNAIKYGGPDIVVEAWRHNGAAHVTVRDDGVGIPEDQRERIFDAYHQAHRHSGTTGSVGLGVTVSRTLARLMDGELVYEHDGASKFSLRLPSA